MCARLWRGSNPRSGSASESVSATHIEPSLPLVSDGAVVVADVRREHVAPAVGAVTHVIKVRVPDVDAAYAQARDAGARVVMRAQRAGSTESGHASWRTSPVTAGS